MAAIKIGFVSRQQPEPVRLVQTLIQSIESEGRGVEVFVDEDLAPRIGRQGSSVAEMEREKVDFIVSVGGDGTILRTIHKMADPLPILGINMGTLGFLVDVEPRDAMAALKKLLSGFVVDERSRLKLLLNGVCMPCATNEIAFLTASPAKMIEFEIMVDGALMEDFRADGVIVATSTGSTAYAM
ncbi:MAG TPA: NAD(+)/NADH kinase, partial [Methanothrix sp.]|nr:NAD(+)/NADH kinase [Methanothrix sp.]